MVEHLKVRVYLLVWGVNSRACLRILNSRAPKGPYSREFGGLTLIIRPHEEAEVLMRNDIYNE
jgi:hypothetical protein